MPKIPMCKFYSWHRKPICREGYRASIHCHEERDNCPSYKPSYTTIPQRYSDEEYYIPVWDCPRCKKEIVLTFSDIYVNPFVKDEEGNPVEICICYCPGCDLVPEDETWIKGYYSEQDLLNKGWHKE